MRQTLTGFRTLFKTAVKENARLTAPWVVIIAVLCVTSFVGYAYVFPQLADRQQLAATIGSNPAFSLIFGPAHNLLSADGFNAWRSLALGSFFAGLMAILIVVRETRAKEDSGQAEMIGASVVGHYAQLAVAVALAWLASLVLGVVAAIACIASGGDIVSSLMLGAAFVAAGVMFAGVAAITCQLASFAGTASSLAITFLGACFLVRGYATTSPDTSWAMWASPLGWLHKTEPAGSNNAWPLLLAVAFTIAAVIIANLLLSRRDFGQGILPAKPGKARAAAVGTVSGLSWRLQSGSIVSWTIVFLIIGAIFGFLISSLGDVFGQNAAIARVFAPGSIHVDLVFEFVGTLLKLLGVVAAVYGVQIMMRLYKEEMDGRVAPILAAAVSRPKLYAWHALIALIGPAVAIILSGCMIALVTQLRGVDISAVDIIKQAAMIVPATWVLIGLSVAIIGNKPALRFGAWLAIAVAFALTILGPMFRLWGWILGISPFYHVPDVAAASPDWIQLFWLCLVIIFFLSAGFRGFGSRDIARV